MNQYGYTRNHGGFEVMREGYRRPIRGDLTGADFARQSCPSARKENGVDGSEGCGCGSSITSKYGVTGLPIGSVYSPLQDFTELYEPGVALRRGTMFSTLDKPLVGAKNRNGGGCRG